MPSGNKESLKRDVAADGFLLSPLEVAVQE